MAKRIESQKIQHREGQFTGVRVAAVAKPQFSHAEDTHPLAFAFSACGVSVPFDFFRFSHELFISFLRCLSIAVLFRKRASQTARVVLY